MAGLIGIEDRFVAQGGVQFGTGRRDGRARLFPRLLRAPQADRDLQRACEEPLHDEARHTTDHRQIGNQRRELRPELAGDVLGQGRDGRLPTRRALTPMTAVLRDVRGDRRQLRHLMPARLAHRVARAQSMGALPTRVRSEIHDRVDALGRYQRTMVS